MAGKPTGRRGGSLSERRVDPFQSGGIKFRDPDYEGGANALSLRQYQREFLAGALKVPTSRAEAINLMEIEIEVDRDPTWRVL